MVGQRGLTSVVAGCAPHAPDLLTPLNLLSLQLSKRASPDAALHRPSRLAGENPRCTRLLVDCARRRDSLPDEVDLTAAYDDQPPSRSVR